MSRLNLLPAAGHVIYSEGDEVDDEDDADDGVGSSRRARRTEGGGRERGLDLDVVDVIGSKQNILPWTTYALL